MTRKLKSKTRSCRLKPAHNNCVRVIRRVLSRLDQATKRIIGHINEVEESVAILARQKARELHEKGKKK